MSDLLQFAENSPWMFFFMLCAFVVVNALWAQALVYMVCRRQKNTKEVHCLLNNKPEAIAQQAEKK